ncbi:MAG: FAD:protein FMN transferase, partial [Thermoguttaceae bacterium]|nr:FAD:protein FMN transferase [Thermoguttaceae bacterium]
GGAFDITVAPLVDIWRFGPDKSSLTEIPSEEQIAGIRTGIGYDKLELRKEPTPALRKKVPEIRIDLSAIAKGYAVDKVAAVLRENGINNYLVEIGGEVVCRGVKNPSGAEEGKPVNWTLGIELPKIKSGDDYAMPELYLKVIDDVPDMDFAIATSGDYRNYIEVGTWRFSHIMDPRSGQPVELLDISVPVAERLGSVSIFANGKTFGDYSCTWADAYATALFVLNEKEGLSFADQVHLPVLYLFRGDDSASSVREAGSASFREVIHSEKF